MSTPHYRRILHRIDPYEGFDASQHPIGLEDFNSRDPIFVKLVELLQPPLILEFGTWKGGSAIMMARALKDRGIEAEIVCVDTWLGSAEHIGTGSRWYDSMRYENGYPRLYYTFLSNVMAAGLQDYITPFANTSEVAFYVFKKLKIRAPLIYVDASHEFPSVVRDLLSAWELLSPDGVLLGDDYNWPEVRDAAQTVLQSLEVAGQPCNFYVSEKKYILSRRVLPLGEPREATSKAARRSQRRRAAPIGTALPLSVRD